MSLLFVGIMARNVTGQFAIMSNAPAILPEPFEGPGNIVRGGYLLSHGRNAKGRRSVSGRGEKALSGRFDEIRKQRDSV
jgi:hypothetical protein